MAPVEESYMCTERCLLDTDREMRVQVRFWKVRGRLRVMRVNIGKLLCICVPDREVWRRFGWEGLAIEEILEKLAKIDLDLIISLLEPKQSQIDVSQDPK